MPWRGQKQLPEADALLLHAYSLYKASLCPCGCGFPADITLDPDADGSIDIDDSRRCAVQAALAEWRESQKDAEPGTIPFPVVNHELLEVARSRSRSGAR